ncbi:PadR family transcriptional regulator [Chelatococcus reniformis]|uniref:PadR family transcriptional regulator n=1 Tax=Chelatococcus reniformis TaxID=1494448 RepID=A0A916XCS3_9HYPH|nr:PadR family transcriptional regulator [Chelatococcus reniformis]GGC62254.1 PadR family transcriptional regulator [Chelatococcus reniformis]
MFGSHGCGRGGGPWNEGSVRQEFGGWGGPGRGGRGFGGRGERGFGGPGGGDFMRIGRMLAHGDLRLLALALIAEQPRHGYEIIKLIEEKTGGWYSPSPGTVYPTLTYLEDAGFIAAASEGSRKLFTITEEGRAHLEENRTLANQILSRLDQLGEKIGRMRRMFGWGDERGEHGPPPLVKAAFSNLREVVAQRLESDPNAEAKVVEVLARAAGELKQG